MIGNTREKSPLMRVLSSVLCACFVLLFAAITLAAGADKPAARTAGKPAKDVVAGKPSPKKTTKAAVKKPKMTAEEKAAYVKKVTGRERKAYAKREKALEAALAKKARPKRVVVRKPPKPKPAKPPTVVVKKPPKPKPPKPPTVVAKKPKMTTAEKMAYIEGITSKEKRARQGREDKYLAAEKRKLAKAQAIAKAAKEEKAKRDREQQAAEKRIRDQEAARAKAAKEAQAKREKLRKMMEASRTAAAFEFGK